MRKLNFILLIVFSAFVAEAQQANCNLKPSSFTIDFSAGDAGGLEQMVPARYRRVAMYCPSDGHYSITPYTSDCFRGDWFTMNEDHTPGDRNGNMLLINSSPRGGMFLATSIKNLKGNTTYEFGVWMMNLCRITEKCPFPLLPDIIIQLQTPEGKNVAQLSIGEVNRVQSPQWKQYQFLFTTPPATTSLNLVMVNSAPGGCGNDFVVDDITFRECVIPPPVAAVKKTTVAKKTPVAKTPVKKQTVPTVKKSTPATTTKPAGKPIASAPVKPVAKAPVKPPAKRVAKPVVKSSSPQRAKLPPAAAVASDTSTRISTAPKVEAPIAKQRTIAFPPPPEALRTRTNALVRRIMIPAGQIKIDLYDNGEIDDDTVSIYHNNRLLKARARLSAKPITFNIAVDDAHPHHEFTMVANNLGSIPPNTSLMIVTAGDTRHEVFISSTKQKNAKVVVDLQEK